MSIASTTARASGARIPLLRQAVVQGGSIYLSDLLPQSSPSGLRAAAQEILVGQSPLPGSIRVLSDEVLIRLLDGEKLLDALEVPGKIVVRRSGRPLSRAEVTAAIQNTLRHNDVFGSVQILPDAVRFPAGVLVSSDDAQLRVTRIEVDRTLHLMEFWLVSGSDPAILPFMVMARPAGGMNELADPLHAAPADEAGSVYENGANRPPVPAPRTPRWLESGQGLMRPRRDADPRLWEVGAGKTARLHLVSAGGTQMYLTATALERGTIGQHIRVRIQPTGRVLQAEVVGHGQLEAGF